MIFEDEKKLTELFLNMQVGQNGKNLNLTLKKIIQLTRVFLRAPKVIVMDEDCLIMPEFDPKFFIESLFKRATNSAVVSIVKNYRQLYHYTRAYILRSGRIVEQGNPLTLVDDKTSHLYKVVVKDDIRTVRQLEMKLEKNIRKFNEDQEATVRYIQELMKKQLESEMNNSNKTEKEKEELRRIVRAISPRNVKDMVKKMKTEIEHMPVNPEFKRGLRMKTMNDTQASPDETQKTIFGNFERFQLSATKRWNTGTSFKNQVTLASKGGVDLFITPAENSLSGESFDNYGYPKKSSEDEIYFKGKRVSENLGEQKNGFLEYKMNFGSDRKTQNSGEENEDDQLGEEASIHEIEDVEETNFRVSRKMTQ